VGIACIAILPLESHCSNNLRYVVGVILEGGVLHAKALLHDRMLLYLFNVLNVHTTRARHCSPAPQAMSW